MAGEGEQRQLRKLRSAISIRAFTCKDDKSSIRILWNVDGLEDESVFDLGLPEKEEEILRNIVAGRRRRGLIWGVPSSPFSN